MRILGLQLFREPIPDDEYIELIRKKLRFPPWFRSMCAVLGFVVIGAAATGDLHASERENEQHSKE